MPVDADIALKVKPVNVTGKLSDLLGVKRQMVDIERAKSETKQTQQDERQRAALASFDVGKIIGDDGTIDLNKIPDSGLREAAGDQFPEVLSKYAQVKQQQIQAKQSLVQLNDTQRASFGEMLGALRSDPDVAQDSPEGRQKVAERFSQYAGIYGADSEKVLKAFAGPLQNAPQGKLAQVIQNIQLQATSAADQASRQAPSYTNTGSQLQQTNPYAQQGQAPGSIPLTIAPGEQEDTISGPDGNLYVRKRAPSGNITGTRPLAQDNGVPSYAPGQQAALTKQSTSNFDTAFNNRFAAQQAPQQLDQIRKAKAISKTVDTGKWSAQRAGLESGLSSLIPGLDAAENDATKLQELDKFLERIAADATKVLGTSANTDAARESISKQNASIGYTPKAIQDVLAYAEAQTMAMGAKGDAQEKWLTEHKGDFTNQHQFETAWRQAYDPVVFQWQAADPEDRKKIVSKLSPKQAAELKEKRTKLREMGAIK